MEIVLRNKIILKGASEEFKQLIANKLRITNPEWLDAQGSGRSMFGIPQFIMNFFIMPNGDAIIPRGILDWMKKTATSLGIPYIEKNERAIFGHKHIDSSKIKFKPYQLDGVSRLISSGADGVLVSPAGSGKTIMGMSLIPMLGQPTLWLTHTGPLMSQAIERAKTFLPDIGDIGMIGAGKWKLGETLTVGMIQTLVRNQERVLTELANSFGMIIVDEAHHCPSRTFSEVAGLFNSYYMYGLTATPNRRDKLEALMFQALGENKTVVSRASVNDHGGIMVPTIRYREIRSKPIDGNNIQYILKQVIENEKRNYVIVGDVIREASEGHHCIVVSDRKEHCEHLFELISKAWEKTSIATGSYSKKYVEEQVALFNEKKITVLVATTALLGEGFDVAFLDRGFLAMPFRAEAKTEQVVGRIQRSYPGKTDAILYDYVDVDIGVLKDQFHNRNRDCRCRVYSRIGANIEPF